MRVSKVINSNINKVINTNKSIIDYVDYLRNKYSFNEEEIKQVDAIKEHLLNMNVLFSKINK